MKIGIDCRTMGDADGISVYTGQLVKNLLKIDGHNNYVLFLNQGQNLPLALPANAEISFFPFPAAKRFLPFVYSQYLVSWFLRRARLDICFFPANTLPLFYFQSSIITVHDLAVYKHPEFFPDRLFNFDRKITVPISIRRAKKIIAVSQSTKNDLLEIFKVKPEKIQVVYEGAGESGEELQEELERVKYFLFLGTIEPRKNLVRLIQAYTKFVQSAEGETKNIKLILAGKSGWKNQEIFTAIDNANTKLGRPIVEYIGSVMAEKKSRLMAGALALVFPSLYEGFGLPALEAMAAGAPVITSNISSLPEITGDAAILVNPLDEIEITAAMEKIATDENLRRTLKEKGQKKAQEFSWEKCAQETLAIMTSTGRRD